MKKDIKLFVPSSLENLSIIRAMIRAYLEHFKVKKDDIMKLISIVDELATNVIEHAYQYEIGDIIIEIDKVEDVIYLSVEDKGTGFDEKKKSKTEGGLGIILVKAISDKFKIEKKDHGTKIKIEKIIREDV